MLTVLFFWSCVLVMPSSRASSRSLEVCPWPSICFDDRSSKVLDLLPPASLPPVQKRGRTAHVFAAQGGTHRFVGASAKLRSRRSTVGKCTGPKWSKMVKTTILVKMTLFRTGFWPKEVYFGPFKSANRTLATPEKYLRLSAKIAIPQMLGH